MSITAREFEDIHCGYGEDISVSHADGRVYDQETCRCGTPLGMHLSLETHRAQELERYVQERITEAAGNNHTEVLTRVIAQIADLDREMNDFPSVPMHIHAILDQIGTEAAIHAGLPAPRTRLLLPEDRRQRFRTHECHERFHSPRAPHHRDRIRQPH